MPVKQTTWCKMLMGGRPWRRMYPRWPDQAMTKLPPDKCIISTIRVRHNQRFILNVAWRARLCTLWSIRHLPLRRQATGAQRKPECNDDLQKRRRNHRGREASNAKWRDGNWTEQDRTTRQGNRASQSCQHSA